MEPVMNLISALARTLLKLTLLAAAVVFALCLLCIGVFSLVLVLLKALLTGRKPAFVTTFQRFRQASRQFGQFGQFGQAGAFSQRDPSAGAGFARPVAGDVVDVQANEVRDDPALPYGVSPDKR
jgi:hypothetical protein